MVDGDKSLVVADKKFVEVAERNMRGIVPLYYNMKKANPIILTNQSLYNGLESAFTGSNIGQYSNNISKIWNSDIFINGTEEERKQAVDIVKLLCMENNFVIDRAKTLYMPTRPEIINNIITSHIDGKVPAFFEFAKDKENEQVEKINGSFVNKLRDIIPNPRINTRRTGLGEIDYKLLMSNPDIEVDENSQLIKKYIKLNQTYYLKVNLSEADLANDYRNVASDFKLREDLLYKNIANEIKGELSKFGYSEQEVSDILVKYLYGIKKSKHKESLWFCYGKYILSNLEKNIGIETKTIQCIDCGEWLEINKYDVETCRCEICVKEHKRVIERLKKQRQRKRKKMSPLT